jgi:ubiquinone/menaquinone biosynthesis C-methylase UbiE
VNIEEYEKMYHLENSYWWFQGRKAIILSLLTRFTPLLQKEGLCLDVGCGTGLILEMLNSYSKPVGLDFSAKALRYCKERGLTSLIQADTNQLPIADASCDLVLALDLLEHISDDKRLMEEFYRICKPGGYICLTVPAHQYLWSEHDEALHHFRRYSKKSFAALFQDSRFTLLKLTYAITVTYLPIVIFRKVQRLLRSNEKPKTHLIPLPHFLNNLLIRILGLEARLLKYLNFPFGVSLIGLARKS